MHLNISDLPRYVQRPRYQDTILVTQSRDTGLVSFLTTTGKYRLHSMASLIVLFGTRNRLEITLIIIIIIAFKGAILDFLQSPHSAANCLQHARSSGSGAIVCKSRATHQALITCKCHVTCHLVRRDSSAIKFD